MLDIEDVYVLRCAKKRTALHVDTVSDEQIENHRGLCLGEWKPHEPIAFKHYSGGSKVYDIITTTYAVLWLVSDRMVDALTGFTGWSTYPVRVTGKNKEPIEGYHGFAITGRCGPIDRITGRKLWRDRPGKGPFTYNRRFYYFDPSTWDGSDIFVPDGPGGIMILEPVMRALKRAKTTNIEMWRLPEF